MLYANICGNYASGLESAASGGGVGNAASAAVSLDAEGRWLTFQSQASDLVAGDANGQVDIFLRDRSTGSTALISRGPGGVQGDSVSTAPWLSFTGRFVTFTSLATTLVIGDTNGQNDAFLYDRNTGAVERLSVATGGAEAVGGFSGGARISADGRFVTFSSMASNLVAGDTNAQSDVFLRDRLLGTTVRISLGPGGVESNGGSFNPEINADASVIAYESSATNLVSGDTNGQQDVFVYYRLTGQTIRASLRFDGSQTTQLSTLEDVSGSGRYALFSSLDAGLVSTDTNAASDVFRRDLIANETIRVSVGAGGIEAAGGSQDGSIGFDGNLVAFRSNAANLFAGDTNGVGDIFVHNISSSVTSVVSLAPGGAVANGLSSLPDLSARCIQVAFESAATNLFSGDANVANDIFSAVAP